MQICFLTKRKMENWHKYTAKLTVLWCDILVKKGTLKRNCTAAISKMRTTSITTKYFCHQPPKWTNIFFM